MNNKPVGYFIKRNEIWWEVDADDREDEDIPLYTHLVKELTDEEIIEVCKAEKFIRDLTPLIDFARAILRKAQEK